METNNSEDYKNGYKCAICLETTGKCANNMWMECQATLASENYEPHVGYCIECLDSHIASQVESAHITSSGGIVCPWKGLCDVEINEQIIQKSLENSVLLQNYNVFAKDAAVRNNPLKTWCPNKGCVTVVDIVKDSHRAIPTCCVSFLHQL